MPETNYKVEVQADSTGTWAGNALKFDTVELAQVYAIDLMCRWLLVRNWRVVTDDLVETVMATMDSPV